MCSILACGKYLQELQNLNEGNLDVAFEDLICKFLQKFFAEKFRIYRNKLHFQNSDGIKCLKGKTPDFIVAVSDNEPLGSVVDIELSKVKMLIEITVKKDDVNKAWRDCDKYAGISQQLKDNKVAVGYISLFSNDPRDIRIEGEKYPYRWTYAAFMPYQNKTEIPWWIWVTNTPGITDSMRVPGLHGSPIYPMRSINDPCGSNWNPFYYLYNVINECLTQRSDFSLGKIKQDDYERLPDSHGVENEAWSAPAAVMNPVIFDGNRVTKKNNVTLKDAVIENVQINYGTFYNETQKISRNALCPCGSGKKYKKCCIDKIGLSK